MGLMLISLSVPRPTGTVSFCIGSMNSIGLSVVAVEELSRFPARSLHDVLGDQSLVSIDGGGVLHDDLLLTSVSVVVEALAQHGKRSVRPCQLARNISFAPRNTLAAAPILAGTSPVTPD